MKKANFLKDLVSQLSEVLPSHVGSLKEDFEKNCNRILSKAFKKFDLVTRSEFDIQNKVLLRTRRKLEDLEKHLAELEAMLNERKTRK